MTLTEFLLARIAEDEAVATATAPSGRRLSWHSDLMVDDDEKPVGFAVTSSGDVAGVAEAWGLERDTAEAVAAHIARHDPARVLAEGEAKRRIVGYAGLIADDPSLPSMHFARHVLADLASIYADHPDYDVAWKP